MLNVGVGVGATPAAVPPEAIVALRANPGVPKVVNDVALYKVISAPAAARPEEFRYPPPPPPPFHKTCVCCG
jgi:hypothetical protein